MLKTLALVLATATASIAHAGPSEPAPRAPTSLFGQLWANATRTRVAQAPNAATVLTGVQKFYAGIDHVTAKFRQEVKNQTFGRSDISDGKLFIAKPGKMRWEYLAKKTKKTKAGVAKSFISNGSYLYVVDHENKQVIKKDLQKNLLPTAVTFLYGKGDLAKDFDPTVDTSGTYGAKTDHVLKLVPKVSSVQYKFLFLVVDPTTFRVKESIIIDGANNSNHFRFYEPDFETTVNAKYFEFDPAKAKAYRVVDGDAPQPGAGPATTPAPTPAAPAR